MSRSRLRRSAAALCGLASLGILAASCSSSTSATSTTSASGATLIAQARTAAEQAGSVSYSVRAGTQATKADPNPPVESLTAQVSAPASAQSIRMSSGSGNLDVIFTGGVAYVRADSYTLYYALALTHANAAKYAGQWISISPSDTPFNQIAQTFTIDGTIASFLPQGTPLIVGKPTKLDGVETTPVTGRAPANSTLKQGVLRVYLSNRTHLPVGSGVVGLTSSGARNSEVAKFLSWGRPVNVTAPQGAVPYSSIR